VPPLIFSVIPHPKEQTTPQPDTGFTAEDVIDSAWIPNSTRHAFRVRLPGDELGIGVAANLTARFDDAAVAAALNFQVEGHGFEAVVAQLKDPDGLAIDPSAFASTGR
jgi:hypothetical protein